MSVSIVPSTQALKVIFSNPSTLDGLKSQLKEARVATNPYSQDSMEERQLLSHEINLGTQDVTTLHGNAGDIILSFKTPVDIGKGKAVESLRIPQATLESLNIGQLDSQEKINQAILSVLANPEAQVEA